MWVHESIGYLKNMGARDYQVYKTAEPPTTNTKCDPYQELVALECETGMQITFVERLDLFSEPFVQIFPCLGFASYTTPKIIADLCKV